MQKSLIVDRTHLVLVSDKLVLVSDKQVLVSDKLVLVSDKLVLQKNATHVVADHSPPLLERLLQVGRPGLPESDGSRVVDRH